MSEIKTYICDVRGCFRHLGRFGSHVRLEIMKPIGSTAPAVGNYDLCDEHLAELNGQLSLHGLMLEIDI